MSLDAITRVKSAEDSAFAERADTAAACKRMLSDAHAKGRALLESELARSAAQVRDILQISEAKAEAEAEEFLKKALDDAAALENGATGKINEAAAFITERIVSAV
ncbi:MAG: hypothetical protein FWH16_04015 [Oscillospiraceae bacterium]|nr:hypothetical protein [Oscillospiraceae bacterium]